MVVRKEEDLDVVESIVGRNAYLRQGMSSAVIILNALSRRSPSECVHANRGGWNACT
jgi:hypothetical protein